MLATAILAHGDFPPWHPVLVSFTAALIPISLLFEILGLALKKEELRAVAWWTLLSAAIITPATALVGWLWLWSVPVDQWQMTIHQWLGTVAAAILIGLAIWRGMLRRRATAPGFWYVAALALFVIAVFVQGELGASMVHGRGLVFIGGEAEPAGADQRQESAQPVDEAQPPGHEHGDGH